MHMSINMYSCACTYIFTRKHVNTLVLMYMYIHIHTITCPHVCTYMHTSAKSAPTQSPKLRIRSFGHCVGAVLVIVYTHTQ